MTNGRSCVTVKLLTQNRQEDQPFVMNKITQDMQFRQSLLRYASKYGVTKAAIVIHAGVQLALAICVKEIWFSAAV